MPSKASLIANLERSRLVIWLLVVIVLVMSFLITWQNVEREANDTAFLVASKRVIERANYYKQQWLLSGQQAQVELDGEIVHFSPSGWVLPASREQEYDCSAWLEMLYPDEEILGDTPIEIESDFINSEYQCHYLYKQDRFMSIGLIDNKFFVKVGFLAN
ncbi:MSHA biogenesis protein MshF [Vibrio aquaticus]|uniref:MSHA biogenesis protein MshF n=1 Tax=Vibrio aquaticus TaxID=2496559 RepID=A0A3S0V1L3_9VIBR|nr:MSHA biogenesis protein MshF [Vibrio aquaticus]RTZ14313.1 MSHA biogenesis protein MshF [Vibrio aquaticus]